MKGKDYTMKLRDKNGGYIYAYDTYRDLEYHRNELDKLSKRQNKSIADLLKCYKGMKVLIIDDSMWELKLISTCFLKLGIETVNAQNAKDGLRFVSGNKWDLVVIDQMMPEMDGMTAVKIIRGMQNRGTEQLPIFMLSSFIMECEEEFLEKYKIQGILNKPIKSDDLEKMILKCMKGC